MQKYFITQSPLAQAGLYRSIEEDLIKNAQRSVFTFQIPILEANECPHDDGDDYRISGVQALAFPAYR